MILLFTTDKNNLSDFFETLTNGHIHDCCDSKVFHRGQEYYHNDAVKDASFNFGKTSLKSIVEGNSDYTVTISIQNGEVSGSCTCPFDGVCKHTIATLFFATNNASEIETVPDAKNIGNETELYLNSLSKDNLIDLVINFAPEQFFVEIKNKFADSSSAQNTFRKVERNINKLFNDDESLYDPDDFESSLYHELRKLNGLQPHLKTEIGDLFIYIINQISIAFDKGYLYNSYNDYPFETSDEFDEFVGNYVKCLNYNEKITFLSKLDDVLNDQTYDTFISLKDLSEKVFTDDDLPLLKNLIITNLKILSHPLIENYYKKVRELLTNVEKVHVLSELQNDNSQWVIELAILFDSQYETIKAVDTIKNWLKKNDDKFGAEDLYKIYLDLLTKAQINLTEAAQTAIFHCPTSSLLTKIASLIPNELSYYESIVEQKRPVELLNYLEANKRLPEAMSLIKRNKNIWEEPVYNFFKKYKMDFQIDAKKYFSDLINKNLEYAGDNYYYAISDAIQQLKVINRSLADSFLNDIRLNYKRRRNLIAMLAKL